MSDANNEPTPLSTALARRPPSATLLRVQRFRRSTARHLLGSLASEVVGMASEEPSDQRPAGLQLDWLANGGECLRSERHHPFDTRQWSAALRALAGAGLGGIDVELLVGGTPVQRWRPGQLQVGGSPPRPERSSAVLEALGWIVDLDGTTLRVQRQWPVSTGRLARLVRLARRASDAPGRVELSAGAEGLELVEDPGDRPSVWRAELAAIRAVLWLPGEWANADGDRALWVVTAQETRTIRLETPGWAVSSTRTRQDAQRAGEALQPLLLATLGRARDQ